MKCSNCKGRGVVMNIFNVLAPISAFIVITAAFKNYELIPYGALLWIWLVIARRQNDSSSFNMKCDHCNGSGKIL